MKKKQLIALGLAAVMVASLAACGGGDSDSASTSGGASAPEETSSTSSGDSNVITYWNCSTEGADEEIMRYGADQYNANDSAESGYTIELTSVQNDKYKEKIVIAMSSGECPDMYTSWSGGPLQEYIDSGFAQPITELYEEAGLDDIYMEAATAQATFDGEVYGVPILNISISGVYYYKDIFEQYGLEEPSTISELEEICDTLVENGITPFALGNSTKWQGSMFYQGLSARYAGLDDFRGAYNGTSTFESDGFIYAGNKILDWASKGYFQEGCNGLSTDDGQDRQAIYQGTAAMLYSGSWYSATFMSDNADFYAEHIGWFPFPECDEIDNGAEYAYVCNGTVGDQFISFNCTGDKLTEAFKCATYFSSDEAIQLMVDNGKIPPVNNVKDLLTDPVSIEICDYVEQATDVQLWYDQYLPTSVANAHLDNSQLLFTQEITSEEVAAATQAAMEEYLAQ